MDEQSIGSRIRAARIAKGATLAGVAQAIGMSTPQAVWQLENDVRDPRASHLLALGTALDVSPAWLLTGNEGERPTVTNMHLLTKIAKARRALDDLMEAIQ